jgi:hypothetical protein
MLLFVSFLICFLFFNSFSFSFFSSSAFHRKVSEFAWQFIASSFRSVFQDGFSTLMRMTSTIMLPLTTFPPNSPAALLLLQHSQALNDNNSVFTDTTDLMDLETDTEAGDVQLVLDEEPDLEAR